jgi:hypothetical protein
MIFGYLMMVIAITISAIAAWYSVEGLTAIFAAAVVPVIIMGGALEAGKITATVWLHNNWARISWAYKTYLIPAIVFLMLLTSMGIFGFLSKAHSDQNLVSGDAMSKVAIYDEQIKTEKDNIDANKRALLQMDAQVDSLLGRTDTERGAERAVLVRKQQAKERSSLQTEIVTAQKKIAKLQEERAPLAAEFRKIEADVGPVKYIAAFVYGDNPDANVLERAVSWIIILIVIVFDPLALCLILASNKQLEWAREDKKGLVHDEEEQTVPVATATEEPPEESPPPYEPYPELTQEQLEQIRAIAANAAVDQLETPEPAVTVIEPEVDQFFANAQATAQTIDADEYHAEDLDIPVLENEEMWAQRVIDEHKEQAEDQAAEQASHEALVKLFQDNAPKEVEQTVEETPPEPVKPVDPFNTPIRRGADYAVRYQGKVYNLDAFSSLHPELSIQADNEVSNSNAAQCGFGEAFPPSPAKGDMFIRTDYLPERLFKWNSVKWIEIDKNSTDSYTYNQAYIQHLIQKLEAGEYEVEDLNDAEQSQVEQQIEDILKNKNA